MRKSTTFFVLACILFSVHSVDAADVLSLSWDYDLGEACYNAYLADIDGDGMVEVIADSQKAGSIYAIKHDGVRLWKYSAQDLIYDLHASGKTASIASSITVQSVDGVGKAKWRAFVHRSFGSTYHAKTVYVSDLDGDGLEETVAGLVSMRGNVVVVFSDDGRKVAQYKFSSWEYPYTLYSNDFDGDGKKEVIVGIAATRIDAAAQEYVPSFSRGGKVMVFGLDGGTKWTYDTGAGIASISSSDLDGDGKPELIAGSDPYVHVLDSDGKLLWKYNAGSKVNDIVVSDFEGDGKKEVVVGAKAVFVLDGSGGLLWSYKPGKEVGSLTVADLDQDGVSEILVGVDRVVLLDSAGKTLWTSEKYTSVSSVLAGDMDGDGYMEVVECSKDAKVRGFRTDEYVKSTIADRYFKEAKASYANKNWGEAIEDSVRAKEAYGVLGDSKKIGECDDLIRKSQDHIEADRYYNLSVESFESKDYANATAYADRALEIFRRLGDMRYSTELSRIKRESSVIPAADEIYRQALVLFEQGNYMNASRVALTAKQTYDSINDVEGAMKSELLLNKSEARVEAGEYMRLAEQFYGYGLYVNATDYLVKANDSYYRVNDTEGLARVENLSDSIQEKKQKDKTIFYGGVGAAALVLIILLLTVFFVLTLLFLKRRKMISFLKKQFGKKEGSNKRVPPRRASGTPRLELDDDTPKVRVHTPKAGGSTIGRKLGD